MGTGMKALGIVRKLDELGRIVIPKEVRDANGWEANHKMEMFADADGGLYIRGYGREAEQQEVIEQLEDLKNRTDNPAVFEVVSQTIAFINERR